MWCLPELGKRTTPRSPEGMEYPPPPSRRHRQSCGRLLLTIRHRTFRIRSMCALPPPPSSSFPLSPDKTTPRSGTNSTRLHKSRCLPADNIPVRAPRTKTWDRWEARNWPGTCGTGDTQAGTPIRVDKLANKYFENPQDELLRTFFLLFLGLARAVADACHWRRQRTTPDATDVGTRSPYPPGCRPSQQSSPVHTRWSSLRRKHRLLRRKRRDIWHQVGISWQARYRACSVECL